MGLLLADLLHLFDLFKNFLLWGSDLPNQDFNSDYPTQNFWNFQSVCLLSGLKLWIHLYFKSPFENFQIHQTPLRNSKILGNLHCSLFFGQVVSKTPILIGYATQFNHLLHLIKTTWNSFLHLFLVLKDQYFYLMGFDFLKILSHFHKTILMHFYLLCSSFDSQHSSLNNLLLPIHDVFDFKVDY